MQCISDVMKKDVWSLALLLPLLAVVYATVVPDMAGQWSDDPNYSHGFLVPLIAGYFIYHVKDKGSDLHS